MEIRQLQVFLAVIDHDGVTRAAVKLGLSPGAVSLQLQNLASQLKTELFVRSGKHLKPTPAAMRLADLARGTVRLVDEIQAEFENIPEADTRPLNFASGATPLIHRLGRPLRLFRKEYPNARIKVTVSDTEKMVAGLIDRRFDLALISLPYPEEGLRVIPLFNEELLIVRPSPRALRSWHIGAIQPEELKSASFILYSSGSNMRTIAGAFFRDIGISPKVVMEADDTETIRGLVECGFGYSILPESALRRRPGFFHAYRVAQHPIVRGQALAVPQNAFPRALTELFANFLKRELSERSANHAVPRVPLE